MGVSICSFAALVSLKLMCEVSQRLFYSLGHRCTGVITGRPVAAQACPSVSPISVDDSLCSKDQTHAT